VIEFWEDQICLRSEWNNYKKIPADVALKERKPGYAWLKLVAVSANHVVVPTRILRDRLIWLGVKKERISIVPVCTEPFTQRDPSVVRNLYNIGKRKVIFSLGSLSAYHDIDCLLRSLIDTNSKDCVLIIAGGWKNSFKEYEPYIQKIKIPVFYVGRLSPVELEYHLSCADICVANYRFAYSSGFFPATVLRYMLAGKPIVVTDLPEIREMFKGQKAGLLVRQHDHIELANTIDFLLKNEQECREMGKTAKNIGEKNYLWQNHSSKIEDVLKKVS
jgi:glycosyltransferase involved in cell wall biosynthesis